MVEKQAFEISFVKNNQGEIDNYGALIYSSDIPWQETDKKQIKDFVENEIMPAALKAGEHDQKELETTHGKLLIRFECHPDKERYKKIEGFLLQELSPEKSEGVQSTDSDRISSTAEDVCGGLKHYEIILKGGIHKEFQASRHSKPRVCRFGQYLFYREGKQIGFIKASEIVSMFWG